MLYWNNVLIESFVQPKCDLRPHAYKGVIAVVDLPRGPAGSTVQKWLEPENHKQSFDHAKPNYKALIKSISEEFLIFATERLKKRKLQKTQKGPQPSSSSLQNANASGEELDNWVQCSACKHWRILPSALPKEKRDQDWFCKDHPNHEQAARGCDGTGDLHKAKGTRLVSEAVGDVDVTGLGDTLDADTDTEVSDEDRPLKRPRKAVAPVALARKTTSASSSSSSASSSSSSSGSTSPQRSLTSTFRIKPPIQTSSSSAPHAAPSPRPLVSSLSKPKTGKPDNQNAKKVTIHAPPRSPPAGT
jgi:hypothetical protein